MQRSLPPATRRARSAFFEQYIFGDSAATLDQVQRRGILGAASAEALGELRAQLAKRLGR